MYLNQLRHVGLVPGWLSLFQLKRVDAVLLP